MKVMRSHELLLKIRRGEKQVMLRNDLGVCRTTWTNWRQKAEAWARAVAGTTTRGGKAML